MDIQTKDGILLRGIPDGTPEDVIKARIEKIRAEGTQPKEVTSTSDRFKQGLKDPIDAGAQMLTHLLPNSVVNAGNKFNNYLAEKTGLVAPIPKGGIDKMLNEQANNYNAPEGMDWARLGGNVLSPANLAIASKLPVAASLAGRVGVGASGGAVLGSLGAPVVGDGKNFAEEKAKQAGTGAIFGGLMPVVTGGLSRLVKPKASSNPNIDLLRKEGVTPTVGQTLGGAVGKAEEKLQSVPILGDMISKARNNANTQFESAAYNRALTPIGKKLPDGINGRDAVVFTEQALKDSYDDVLNKIGAIKPDTTFNNNLQGLESKVNNLFVPKAVKQNFTQAMNELKGSIDNNGYMTSESYKIIESTLGQDAKKLGLGSAAEGKVSTAVKQLQAELKDMLKRQAGSHADDLQKSNAGWANFKRLQNASAKIGAPDGNFTPAQFQNAVRALDGSKDKGAFARGNALMQDLGDAGKSVLTGRVADSGTAGRALLGGGALASGALNPAIPAALLGAGALYTNPMQKLLNSLIVSRPNSATKAADLIRQSSNYMLPASSAIGFGLLQ